MKTRLICLMMLLCGVWACEEKKATTEEPTATTPEETKEEMQQGEVKQADGEAVPDMSSTRGEDMAGEDQGSGQRLKLQLDTNLLPATKSGPMPNFKFNNGGGGKLKLNLNNK